MSAPIRRVLGHPACGAPLLGLPAGLLLFLAACSHSGLGETTSGESGATPPDDTTEPGLHDCPWVGTWTLSAVKCGSFDYPAWYEDHDAATLEIDHDPDGGCAVVAQITSAECNRSEEWTFGVPVGGDVEVTLGGITDCTPDGCQFSGSEDPCVVGGLTGAQTLAIDDGTGDLVAEGLITDTAPACTLPLLTTWTN